MVFSFFLQRKGVGQTKSFCILHFTIHIIAHSLSNDHWIEKKRSTSDFGPREPFAANASRFWITIAKCYLWSSKWQANQWEIYERHSTASAIFKLKYSNSNSIESSSWFIFSYRIIILLFNFYLDVINSVGVFSQRQLSICASIWSLSSTIETNPALPFTSSIKKDFACACHDNTKIDFCIAAQIFML